MSGDVHVRFCEGGGVRFPSATRRVLVRLPTGKEYYYLPRELYSVAALTDETGAITEAATYDTYGQVAMYDQTATSVPQSEIGNVYYFTGRRLDLLPTASSPQPAAKQLYHYRAREYDPGNGRFMQRDPIANRCTQAIDQLVSLYEYVGSSPLRLVDPTGLVCQGCQSPKQPPASQPTSKPSCPPCEDIVTDYWNNSSWVRGKLQEIADKCGADVSVPKPVCKENCGNSKHSHSGYHKCEENSDGNGHHTKEMCIKAGQSEDETKESIRHELIHALQCCQGRYVNARCDPRGAASELEAYSGSGGCAEYAGQGDACLSCLITKCAGSLEEACENSKKEPPSADSDIEWQRRKGSARGRAMYWCTWAAHDHPSRGANYTCQSIKD